MFWVERLHELYLVKMAFSMYLIVQSHLEKLTAWLEFSVRSEQCTKGWGNTKPFDIPLAFLPRHHNDRHMKLWKLSVLSKLTEQWFLGLKFLCPQATLNTGLMVFKTSSHMQSKQEALGWIFPVLSLMITSNNFPDIFCMFDLTESVWIKRNMSENIFSNIINTGACEKRK